MKFLDFGGRARLTAIHQCFTHKHGAIMFPNSDDQEKLKLRHEKYILDQNS